jgi:PAS domain S-box-containing protein
MEEKLKLLILEDVLEDLELVLYELRQAEIKFNPLHVETEEEFKKGLIEFKPDLILSDYKLPQFTGMEALLITKEISPLTPFIIITGSINEETAVKCIKNGAWDYVTKEHLTRLGAAVNQALEKKILIDKKIETEKALVESEERYKQIYQFSPDSIIIHDMDMNILNANNKAVEEFGYSKAELLKKTIFELHPETEQKHSANVLADMKKKEILNIETTFVRKDGSVFLAEATPCKYTLGSKPIIHVVIRDITARRQVEEELKINRERLKTATSILRHDIINDLSVIKSAVDIYRNEQDETMIDEIEKRVERTINTIHNQRDQVKFLDTHIDLDEYDLKEVVHEVIKKFRNLEINITGAGKVYADHAIYSVIENIISNAVRHGKTSKLDIDIRCGKEFCEIRLADNGIGIPDEIKDKIFDEGFHYGESGHTGIGLYIVKRTIEEYNGEVFLEDNQPHGAVFIIRLKKTIEKFKNGENK